MNQMRRALARARHGPDGGDRDARCGWVVPEPGSEVYLPVCAVAREVVSDRGDPLIDLTRVDHVSCVTSLRFGDPRSVATRA